MSDPCLDIFKLKSRVPEKASRKQNGRQSIGAHFEDDVLRCPGEDQAHTVLLCWGWSHHPHRRLEGKERQVKATDGEKQFLRSRHGPILGGAITQHYSTSLHGLQKWTGLIA